MKKSLLVFLILISASAVLALPGDLDTTFGVSGGYVVSDFEAALRDERHRDTALQIDGKIVVVGRRETATANFFEFFAARYNTDGTPDTTFSGDGFFNLNIGFQLVSANAVAIQSDGKIVVAGGVGDNISTAYLFRLNADGTLDTTFDADGIVSVTNSGEALSMAIQTDGKIVLGTTFNGGAFPAGATTVMVRLNGNGSLDTTFDGDGRLTVSPNLWLPFGLALQPDGKIVAAGRSSSNAIFHDVAVIRLNSNATYDTTFDSDGVVTTALTNQESEARSVILQSGGKIVIGGGSSQPLTTSRYDPTLLRYNADGSLDTSFDGDGVRIIELLNNNEDNYFYDLVQQTDGKIIGISSQDGNFPTFVRDDFFVTRFNSDGSTDNSFDANGIVKSQWCEDGTELALQPDGKIVAVGSQDRPTISTSNHGICVQRFNSDGAVDYSLNSSAPNGRVILSSAGFDEIEAIAGLPNGKIMAAGWGDYGGIVEARLIRLNANGTLDTTFMDEGSYVRSNAVSGNSTYFYDLKVLSDGSFFVAGDAGSLGAMILKFTSAGIPDTTFSGDGVATSTNASRFYAVAVQTDGKVLGCGSSGSTIRGGRIVRFSATGSFEASAANNLGAFGNNNEIYECGFQSDGKLIVAGFGYDSLNANDYISVSRHLANLSIDTTFGTSGVTTTNMSATLNDRATDLVIQSDNKVVVSSMGFNTDRDFAVLRYDANGTLDPNFTENFGTGGISLIDFTVGSPNDEANSLLIQPDGQMIVGGSSNAGTGERFGLAKINVNGSLALGFGTLGRTISVFPNNDARIKALSFYLNDKILAAGRTWNGTNYDFAVARYQNEFIPTAANVSVSGRVLTGKSGVRNVIVTLTDTNGNVMTTRTNSFGNYRFDEITVGETYIVSVYSRRFTFDPSSIVLNVSEELTDVDFAAQE